MGVIGMKVYAAGVLLRGGGELPVTSAEAMGYVLSLAGVSTVIIGCSSPAEVDENARNRSLISAASTSRRCVLSKNDAHAHCRLLYLVQKTGMSPA